MVTDYRLSTKEPAKVNVNTFMICGSTWLWPLCRWHYPVLPSPYRGHARDDSAPPYVCWYYERYYVAKWMRRKFRRARIYA